jgi:hypothetical protein
MSRIEDGTARGRCGCELPLLIYYPKPEHCAACGGLLDPVETFTIEANAAPRPAPKVRFGNRRQRRARAARRRGQR